MGNSIRLFLLEAHMKNPKLVAAKLTLPTDQVQAINTAVSQITAALGTSEQIPSMLRAEAAKLNEMADLIELVAEDKMDDEDKEEKDEKEPVEEKPAEKK
jgi:hypothetical protein